MFALLRRYIRKYWLQLILILLVSTGQALAQTSLPMYFNQIIKNGVTRGDMDYVWFIGTRMLIMTVGLGIFMILCGYISAFITARVVCTIRNDLFRKILTFTDQDYGKFGKESLLTRLSTDSTQIQIVVINMLRNALIVPFVAIFTFLRCLFMDAPLTLILIGAFLISAIIVLFGRNRSTPIFQQVQEGTDRVSTLMSEKLTGARTIRAFNRQDYEIQKLTEANNNVYVKSLQANRMVALMNPIVQVIMSLTVVLILWFGLAHMRRGLVNLADLLTYIQYALQLASGFSAVMVIIAALPKCTVSARRILEVLDHETEAEEVGDPTGAETSESRAVQPLSTSENQDEQAGSIGKSHGEIRIRDLTFGYQGAEENVLDIPELIIPAGKVTAIVGATGSGKSTLVKLLLQFFDRDYKGDILFDGVESRGMSRQAIRSMISYAPQQAELFAGTVAGNLAVASPEASEEEMWRACDLAMVTEYLKKQTSGLDLPIAQGGTNLSGGQRQRLSLARAFVKEARIYILDDSFSALDFKTDAAIRASMRSALAGKTVILVAQRIQTIMDADQILVMEDGRIAAVGRHEELLETSRIYQDIYRSQESQNGKGVQP